MPLLLNCVRDGDPDEEPVEKYNEGEDDFENEDDAAADAGASGRTDSDDDELLDILIIEDII